MAMMVAFGKSVGKKNSQADVGTGINDYFWLLDGFKCIFPISKHFPIKFNVSCFQPEKYRMLDAWRGNLHEFRGRQQFVLERKIEAANSIPLVIIDDLLHFP